MPWLLIFIQIDFITLCWAVHKLSGVVSPGNASYSASELEHQLRDSKAKVLFTCAPLLSIGLEAAAKVGIPKDNIYLLEVPGAVEDATTSQFKTVEQLITVGKTLPSTKQVAWTKGQGRKQVAFLCYSSGTSGLPVRTGSYMRKSPRLI